LWHIINNRHAAAAVNAPTSVKLLEAIYIINTNAGQALQHKGALFAEIAKAARQSLTLQEKFKQCFPPHFGDKEKK
jgi:hypothetical protein